MEGKINNDLQEWLCNWMEKIRKNEPRFRELAMRYLRGEKLSCSELEDLCFLVNFFSDYGEELPQDIADVLRRMDDFPIKLPDDEQEVYYADLALGLRWIMEDNGDWIDILGDDEPLHDVEEWLSVYGIDD